MRYCKVLLMILALMILSACNLSAGPPTSEPIDNDNSSQDVPTGKPVVTIASPESGSEVVVGSNVLVSANATDSVGVTRVQLIANNQIVKTVSSESVSGDKTMNALLDYKPSAAGEVTLQVIAYRSAVASDPAEITVTVRSNQAQVTATIVQSTNVPVINPNDPTCRALTNTGLNLRTGPGTEYPRITVLNAGAVVPIIGRTGTNQWWQVRASTLIGWVSAQFTTVYGVCTNVPIVQPPPPPVTIVPPTSTPTRTPTPTPQPPGPTNTPLPADLVIPSIIGPENTDTITIPAGESSVIGMVSVTITNTGSSSTGTFNNTIQILPGGELEDLGVVGNLAPGESISLSIDLTFTSTGTFTLRVTADSDSNVSELSEFNNIGTFEITVNAES